MKDKLAKMKARRQDITDWVIHWTRDQYEYDGSTAKDSLEVLKEILICGYLKPTKAPRPADLFGAFDTIRGDFSAVCFSAQPLSAFLDSYLAHSRRYSGCGIAFEKRHLFQYGARPVIYGDKDLLNRLHSQDKYLWVKYSPLSALSRDYPIDWTHEREWRTRWNVREFPEWGPTPEEGVPLVLPPITVGTESLISLPRIIVVNSTLAEKLFKSLKTAPEYTGNNLYIKYLRKHYMELKIITLENVMDKLHEKDERWSRLDTIPVDELPSVKDFTQ